MDRSTDDRLDEIIDAAARRMTAGAPRPGLASRVAARLERRRPFIAPAWQLASAAIVVAIAVFALVELWPGPAPERVAAPPVAPASRPATPTTPSTTLAANAKTSSPVRETRPRRRPVQTIVIERRGDDIPALDGPAALAVDTTRVAELHVAPLDVQELSVAPLETGTDRKPQ